MLSPTTLTFCVLALVIGDRPLRTGAWFYLGALTASAAQYIVDWLFFTLVALLPLAIALIMLLVARERTQRALQSARTWLERNARTVAAVILLLLAAALLRNGIAGLTA